MKTMFRNIYSFTIASVRFALFVLWIIPQIPIALILWPFGRRAGVWQFKMFTSVVLRIAGIRVRIYGTLSKKRPLLLVGNHISVFEFMTLPATFGASFFGKDDIARYPVVGQMAWLWGVVFISRKPSQAEKTVRLISDNMKKATWPMVIYPEGTTTNGSVVLPFKSSMFDFIEKGVPVTVQPMVMFYRDKRGNPIDDQILADDYAYFDNVKMPAGAKLCRKERNAVSQIFHVFALGGFTVEFRMLPPPPLAGKNRKQIAAELHEIINNKFMELK
ncbi:MAG: 1-acyl-sn-glycerol-3-phosphate acyltransferase [Proteobacteria bacterium]|nr:1-acyl-sn-glycerol-3-phosphate acyltransferase [Pseudomonadota bacterium]